MEGDPLTCDLEIQRLAAVIANRRVNRMARSFSMRAMTQPPPPAPQTLAARPPCCMRHFNQLVNQRGSDARRVACGASFHSSCISAATSSQLVPPAPGAWPGRCARSRAKLWIDLLVAVNVLLEDLPVVDPRVPRRAGVEQHEALVHLFGGNGIASRRTPSVSRWMALTPPYIAG